MSDIANIAGLDRLAVARAVVQRVDGTTEVYYSHPRPQNLRQYLKLRKHLHRMKKEDRND